MFGEMFSKLVYAVAVDVTQPTAASVESGVGHATDIVAASKLEPFASGDVY
jgi:hypothetical protein